MVLFFLPNSQQKFYPKNGSFWLFSINQKYAETTLLIDKKIISQEASYAAQQSLRRFNLQKFAQNVKKLFSSKNSGFYIVKIKFIDYQVKTFSLILVFEDLTLLKLC